MMEMKELAKEVRKTLKQVYPDFKFSVTTRQNPSVINVSILKGPVNFPVDSRGFNQVNHKWVEEHWKDYPEAKKILKGITDLLERDNHIINHDADYGSIPNYYIHLEIGKFPNPYQFTGTGNLENRES